MSLNEISKQSTDYHIGIITALPIERAAFTWMLDARHTEPWDFNRSRNDSNAYTWGNIGLHNLVITSLAAGIYGTTMATNTAISMMNTFPSVKFGIMVGIGAGIPTLQHDIRLGDVVVSQPFGTSGGVFQYDLGKAMNGEWERKDFLTRPPDALLHALSHLQSEHQISKARAPAYLAEALDRGGEFAAGFSCPQHVDDCLFQASYCHQHNKSSSSCISCDSTYPIPRSARPSPGFNIHYGLIASGNTLVKDAILRDRIASFSQQCICIETEAAGLMNNFPCMVIRGICDYADTHKNDAWQRYASATAAAVAKELLKYVPFTGVHINSRIAGIPRDSYRSEVDLPGLVEAVEPADFKAFLKSAL